MVELKGIYLEQLDFAIRTYDAYRQENLGRPGPYLWTNEQISHFISLATAAINRIAGPDSVYGQQANSWLKSQDHSVHSWLIGVVRALRDDVDRGYLTNLKEIVRGELFSDFLDMADYLAKQDYKDPAAVMVGGVLESHLHQLCIKHGIDIEQVVNGQTQKKRAEQLNQDLAKEKVYDKLELKSVTMFLDLRNKAAHVEYEKYTKDQVVLMLQWMRTFIARYPA